MDNLRVSELAKELNITSKELIEKFAEISITVKSHSNVVTPDQIRKVKEHLGVGPKKNAAKKAFIVKKAKPAEEPEVVKTPVKEPAKIERIERVQKVEKAPKIEVQKQMQEITDLRRSQVGTGDRSERIRTYNFPQGRLTDHRIGQNLNVWTVIDGDLEDLLKLLIEYDQKLKLEKLAAGE